MPASRSTPGVRSERPPSPVKRKKSLARSTSASPIKGSPTPRHHREGLAPASSAELRSFSGIDPTKKPPRAPQISTGASHATIESSPSESHRSMTPRPMSPGMKFPETPKDGGKDRERVRVFVRMRPMRADEGESTVRLDTTGTRLWLAGERSGTEAGLPLQFDFDGVLPADVMQQQVYETVAQPLVEAATAGQSACLMCYGQTGTGKTYTFGGGALLSAMTGGGSNSSSGSGSVAGGGTPRKGHATHAAASSSGSTSSSKKPPVAPSAEGKSSKKERKATEERQGVVGRAMRHILEWATPRGFRVCVAYVQVYMELLQDLLRPESTLTLREHPDLGVYIDGALWKTVASAETACAEVAAAETRRTTAFTKLNADSSRSHAVLMIAIRAASDAPTPLTSRSELPSDVAWASARGRLFLVDLAGSERTKRSGVVGQSFDEACSINQSLTTLGRCIQALASKKGGGFARAPVRESKLTRLLSPCLGGSTTSLVCCCSGAFADRYETQNTLEFGRNAMKVLLKPQTSMNVDFRSLTIELQAQLDMRTQSMHEMEVQIEARVRAEYREQLAQLEAARREALAARHQAEALYDRRAKAEKAAEERAAAATADLKRLAQDKESHVQSSRASHDSRAAIIATADSLAEEVVRARRDRDDALEQLHKLTQHMQAGTLAMMNGGVEPAALDTRAESAAGLEGVINGGLAELAVLRAQIERRKMRTRAAAARIVPSSLGAGLSSMTAGTAQGEAQVAASRKAMTNLRMTMASMVGGMGELLAACIELGETQHPDLWQGTAENLAFVEQIRAAQRLTHMLGLIQQDFSQAEVAT